MFLSKLRYHYVLSRVRANICIRHLPAVCLASFASLYLRKILRYVFMTRCVRYEKKCFSSIWKRLTQSKEITIKKRAKWDIQGRWYQLYLQTIYMLSEAGDRIALNSWRIRCHLFSICQVYLRKNSRLLMFYVYIRIFQ